MLLPQLRAAVIPGKVENIVQDDMHNLYIEIKRSSSSVWMNLCWHPDFAHVGVGCPTLRAEPLPFSLAAIARQLLKGLNVIDVSLSGYLSFNFCYDSST
jgi:predicted ribosome quality control (RQC) complex YloA/Tae2 family protein